jgi:hypothetical protein
MAGCCACVRDDYQAWSCDLLGLWPGVRRAARSSTQSPPRAPGCGPAQRFASPARVAWCSSAPRAVACAGRTSASTGTRPGKRSSATLMELMARLGHSSVRAATIYQHATRDRDQAIAQALGILLREAGGRVVQDQPERQERDT